MFETNNFYLSKFIVKGLFQGRLLTLEQPLHAKESVFIRRPCLIRTLPHKCHWMKFAVFAMKCLICTQTLLAGETDVLFILFKPVLSFDGRLAGRF